MPHTIYSFSENILTFGFTGGVDDETYDRFYEDFLPYLESATPENKLNIIIDASQDSGRMSPYARKQFTKLNKDKRVKKVAIINAQRINKVIGQFIMAATNRKNIRFFDNETDAKKWFVID